MATGQYGAVLRQIHRLFGPGTVSGLTEWQLLHRYLTERDEVAFGALVARHGPMVLGVCRRVLDDPDDVEDAFQATFLVLVRKARGLGERDVLGHWLYGVAYRVALKARGQAARRRVRERPDGKVVAMQPAALGEPPDPEIRPILDAELSRLPDKYRKPLVLCYLEGVSHEEAARQLGWPLGTVKGRLARARELLRARLTRRGVTVPAAALATALAREASAAVPSALLDSTVQAAMAFAAGPAAAVGAISASALTLSEGALRAMSYTHLKLAAVAILTATSITTGAAVVAWQDQGAEKPTSQAKAAGPGPEAAAVSQPQPTGEPSVNELAEARLKAAVDAARAGKADWDAGRITLDRFIGLSRKWLEAERDAAGDPRAELAAYTSHLERMQQVEARERAQMEEGRATAVDLAEAHAARREAELWLSEARLRVGPSSGTGRNAAQAAAEEPKTDALGQAWLKLAQQDYDQTRSLFREGQESAGTLLQASQQLMEAQRETSTRPEERTAAIESHIKRIQQLEDDVAARVRAGQARAAAVNRIRMYRAGAEYLLARTKREPMKAASDDAASDPKSRAVLSKLDDPIPVQFPDETPLEDVLKYIKAATQGPNDGGIPVYVDERGLQEAEKTLQSPVRLDLEGVPLRITLRLMLQQIGLTYTVRDGLLIITSPQASHSGLLEASAGPSPLLEKQAKADRGELSSEEIHELIEQLKAIRELHRLQQEDWSKGASKAAQ